MPFFVIFSFLFFIFFIIFVVMYNSLIRIKNDVENAFGRIDVLLQRRYDLIPNLIASVKKYMTHEHDTLTKISELRSMAVNNNLNSEEKVTLDNQLNRELNTMMLSVEAYPELKSNKNFINLERVFNDIESQIASARLNYNSTVTDFNDGVQMFPSSIVAGMMNLKSKKLFEVSKAERVNPNAGELFGI